ncbi:hypothetical protein HAX54_045479, partial [Datura stramonium]|nr:hypothetical protein [Datura stramonium]
VKWAQRPDVGYLTVNLDSEGVFNFSATVGVNEDRLYELKLEVQDKVNLRKSKISILYVLQKSTRPKLWTKLLHGDRKEPHYVKVN